MKRFFLVMVALILTALSLCGCGNKAKSSFLEAPTSIQSAAPTATPQEEPFDFRSARWGMTRQAVEKTESGVIVDQDDVWMAYHSDDIAGMSATVGYKFEDGKLIAGLYLIEEEHTNENDYIDDFNKLKESLTSVYGAPIIDKHTWGNDLYEDDPQMYGFAVSCGHLKYIATWKTETTDIGLVLSGDNFEIGTTIAYEAIGYVAPINDNGL